MEREGFDWQAEQQVSEQKAMDTLYGIAPEMWVWLHYDEDAWHFYNKVLPWHDPHENIPGEQPNGIGV